MSATSPQAAPTSTANVAHTARSSVFVPNEAQAAHRDRLVGLANALCEAQGTVDLLLAERRRVLAEARDGGVPVGTLAEWTGLGRQRIGQLLAGKEK